MDYLKIGFIKKSHGLKGELKIFPLTDDILRFKSVKTIYIDDNIYSIISCRVNKDEVILKLKEINSVEESDLLKNKEIFIERTNGLPLDEWEFYSQDLIDSDLIFNDKVIGKVVSLCNYGAGDLLEIVYNNKSYYYPFLRKYINKIDTKFKKIEINQVEGFFE